MDVHILGWIGLAAIILTLIVIDIVGHVRTPHEPTMKEAAVWSVAYIGMALVFGGIVWFVWGGGFAQEYLAGYITEKALSIDNLFVFVIMMSSFKVPRKYQQEVLLAGIVIALILRLIFILAGAALIENFSLTCCHAWSKIYSRSAAGRCSNSAAKLIGLRRPPSIMSKCG